MGRDFTDRDVASSLPVIIVNESMAKAIAPEGNVIGTQIQSRFDENLGREIIGVVSDLAYSSLRRAGQPAVFVPNAQSPRRTMGFMVRTEGEPLSALTAVGSVMRGLDPDVAMANVASLEEVLHRSLAAPRFAATLLGLFGLLALGLATVGVYGLVSFSVAERTREIGIRMALGAQSGRVRMMVLRQAAVIAAVGIGLGAAGGLGVARLLSRAIFGISPLDPVAFFGMAILLGGATLAASYQPARRATRVDPLDALRQE